MTKNKRYFALLGKGYVYPIFFDGDNNREIDVDTVVDLLNKLNDENEELRKEGYGNLDGLNYYQEQNGHLSERVSELECENEQLKSEIETLHEQLAHFDLEEMME